MIDKLVQSKKTKDEILLNRSFFPEEKLTFAKNKIYDKAY